LLVVGFTRAVGAVVACLVDSAYFCNMKAAGKSLIIQNAHKQVLDSFKIEHVLAKD
jgi:hypothetical protein